MWGGRVIVYRWCCRDDELWLLLAPRDDARTCVQRGRSGDENLAASGAGGRCLGEIWLLSFSGDGVGRVRQRVGRGASDCLSIVLSVGLLLLPFWHDALCVAGGGETKVLLPGCERLAGWIPNYDKRQDYILRCHVGKRGVERSAEHVRTPTAGAPYNTYIVRRKRTWPLHEVSKV